MNKEKDKPQIINNIQKLNLEIDYDKLAEAIVKAQKGLQKPIKREKKFREKAMSFFNGMIYVFVCIISIMCIVQVWKDYNVGVIDLFASIFSTVVFAFSCIYAFLCQQESHTDDGQTAQSHFNTNIALIALIVALVALFKGVG